MREEILRFWSSKRARIWTILLALVALGLTQVPLFRFLGFEFALAVGPLVVLASAHLGAWSGAGQRSFGRALGLAWLLFLLPSLLIGLAATWLGDGCDPLSGLAFFAIGPGLGSVWGVGLGYGLGAVRGLRGYRWLLCWILLRFLFNVWWFLAHPPIFAYNPLLGYFPGSLYDERIEIELPYVWFRLGNGLEALGFFLAGRAFLLRRAKHLSWRNFAGGAALSLTAAALLALSSGTLGFRRSAENIQQALGGHAETEHFHIYYPLGSDTAQHIDLVAREHEYRYARFVEVFGAAPEGKISSYIYGGPDEKHVLFGTRHTQFAKPWLRQIHLNAEPHPHTVLPHELAHVMSGAFADWPFRTAGRYSLMVNVGLIEGLAVAFDWRSDDLDPHQWAAAMRRLGIAPPVEQLFSPTGFFGQTAGLSYTLSGSFVRFLLDTYGPEPLKRAYRSGDLESAYGLSLGELTTRWNAFLDGLPLPESALEVARGRFQRPSIFSKLCAHEQAARRAEVTSALLLGDMARAAEILQSLCDREPQNPRPLAELADAYTSQGFFSDAERALFDLLKHPKSYAALLTESLNDLGDLAFRAGDLDRAHALYTFVYARHLSDDTDRVLEVKLSALKNANTQEGISRYLFAREEGRETLLALRELWQAEPDYAPAPYLVGRLLHSRGESERAIPYLEASLRLGLPGPSLTRECIRLLGVARALSGRREEARLAFESLSAGEHGAGITLGSLDWRARLSWELNGGLLSAPGIVPDKRRRDPSP